MLKQHQFLRFLVVVNNIDDFTLLKNYVYDYFFNSEVIHVKDFVGLSQVEDINNNFDIIFLDLLLPDKSGEDLITSALNIANAIPVVILTSHPNFDFAIQSLSFGISDYLLKEELSSVVLYKCILYNIERYKSIITVKNSEQYYLDLFQLSPHPLIVYNEESNIIVDVNYSAVNTYQYTYEEFTTKQVENLNVENIYISDLNEYLSHNVTESLSKKIECHQKKGGGLLYVACRSNKIVYKGRESIILSIENLTKEIRYFQSIQTQNKKLKEIAWIQSHVVRAPIARIMGLIQLFVNELTKQNEKKMILQMLMETSLEVDAVLKNIVEKANDV